MKKNKTGILAALVVAALAVGAYFALRDKKGGEDDGDDPNGGGGSGETTPGLKFSAMADTIFDAMDGYGTNEDDIEQELEKLKSRGDWNALVAAYGTRTLSSGRGNIFQSDFTGDLESCLRNELDGDEQSDVNEILKKIGVSI